MNCKIFNLLYISLLNMYCIACIKNKTWKKLLLYSHIFNAYNMLPQNMHFKFLSKEKIISSLRNTFYTCSSYTQVECKSAIIGDMHFKQLTFSLYFCILITFAYYWRKCQCQQTDRCSLQLLPWICWQVFGVWNWNVDVAWTYRGWTAS